MPDPDRPIREMNKPIPTETAFLSVNGIASKITSLPLKNDRAINIIPSINTAVNANSQESPWLATTEYANYALRPIPGAKANGYLAYNAMINVAIAADSAVAVKIAF